MTGHRVCVLFLALVAGSVVASPAYAAKGAKNNALNNNALNNGALNNGALNNGALNNGAMKNETVRGQVVGMHTDRVGVAMTVKVHHHKKQGMAAANVAGVHHAHRTFQLTNATRVERVGGQNHQAAGIGAIHLGSHVLVHARGHQAETVLVAGQTGRGVTAATALNKRRPNANTGMANKNGMANRNGTANKSGVANKNGAKLRKA